MKKVVCLMGVILAFFAEISAEDVSNRFDDVMLRMRNHEVIRYEYDYFCTPENAMSTIVSSGKYYMDSMPEIRCQAYRYASKAALQCNNDSVKMMVVEDLLRSCNDSASIVVQNACQELANYDRKCFTEKSISILEQIIDENEFFPERFFLIGGYVGSENMASILKSRYSKCAKREHQWYIDIALCRLNDNSSIQKVLSKVSKMEITLDFIDGVLPYLLYTRQRGIYDWLIDKTMSDECKCASRNPNSEMRISCAYYIVYEMADYIADFPINRDEDGEKDDDLSKSDVKRMRTWMMTNPNYEIIDSGY